MQKTLIGWDTALVTFRLPAEVEASQVTVLGEFNEWTPDVHLMSRDDSGFFVDVPIATGKAHHFRYLPRRSPQSRNPRDSAYRYLTKESEHDGQEAQESPTRVSRRRSQRCPRECFERFALCVIAARRGSIASVRGFTRNLGLTRVRNVFGPMVLEDFLHPIHLLAIFSVHGQ